MDLYKYAARNSLRFPSTKGDLTVEQLFAMPLVSKVGFDLDSVARAINKQLKDAGEESFVAERTSPAQAALSIKLDIVKDVIATKQAENLEKLTEASKKAEKQRLLDALARVQDKQLEAMSADEIQARLKALEA